MCNTEITCENIIQDSNCDPDILKIKTSSDVYLFDASEQARFDHENALLINNKIPFVLNREFLIKLLPAEKVTVVREYPVETGEVDKTTGAMTYSVESKEEVIDNPVVEAIILALPKYPQDGTVMDYVVGEHIIVSPKSTMPFYMFRDACIISGFNIIGKIKPWAVEGKGKAESKIELEPDTENIELTETAA